MLRVTISKCYRDRILWTHVRELDGTDGEEELPEGHGAVGQDLGQGGQGAGVGEHGVGQVVEGLGQGAEDGEHSDTAVLQLDDAVPVQGVLVLGEACAHEGGDACAGLRFGSWLILETGWQTRYRQILSPKLENLTHRGGPRHRRSPSQSHCQRQHTRRDNNSDLIPHTMISAHYYNESLNPISALNRVLGVSSRATYIMSLTAMRTWPRPRGVMGAMKAEAVPMRASRENARILSGEDCQELGNHPEGQSEGSCMMFLLLLIARRVEEIYVQLFARSRGDSVEAQCSPCLSQSLTVPRFD